MPKTPHYEAPSSRSSGAFRQGNYFDIVGVTGSIPVTPTIQAPDLQSYFPENTENYEAPSRFTEPDEPADSIVRHLRQRHVNPRLYNIAVDEADRTATFMLHDLSGALTGYQQYRPDAGKEKKNHPREGRYFTYKTKGRIAVFGLETWRWSRALFLTEGIFDCVRLHNAGLAALALLSNDPKNLRTWLWTLQRPIYAVCDDGPAGRKLAKFAHRHWTCGERDLGDMAADEVLGVIEYFDATPPQPYQERTGE